MQHSVEIRERRIGRKAQHGKTLRLKKCIAPGVVPGLIGVLRAVELDDQARLQAGKVRHIRTQRVLAAKFHAQLLAAQTRPQPTLAVSHGAAQRVRVGTCS